jgi:hypothetical protein
MTLNSKGSFYDLRADTHTHAHIHARTYTHAHTQRKVAIKIILHIYGKLIIIETINRI